MKRLSEKITDYILKSGVINKESYALYQYGVQISLEMISCLIVCFLMAWYLHMILKFLVSPTILMSEKRRISVLFCAFESRKMDE